MNENGNCRILYNNFAIMILKDLHTVFQLEAQYSFLDYVMGGCQINFTVRSDSHGTIFVGVFCSCLHAEIVNG